MKRAAFVLSLLLVLWVGALAQDNPDFSGTYHLVSIKADNPSKKLPASALTIVHREGIIERTDVTDGKSLVRRYTLDGKECKNVTSGGAPSTDRAGVKRQKHYHPVDCPSKRARARCIIGYHYREVGTVQGFHQAHHPHEG